MIANTIVKKYRMTLSTLMAAVAISGSCGCHGTGLLPPAEAKQTVEFCGITARASRIIYIIDFDADSTVRLEPLMTEVRHSVQSLTGAQSFNINLLFQESLANSPVVANAEEKARALAHILTESRQLKRSI